MKINDFDLVISNSGKKGLVCCDGKDIAWFNGKATRLQFENDKLIIPIFVDRIIRINNTNTELDCASFIIATVLNTIGDESRIISELQTQNISYSITVIYDKNTILNKLIVERDSLFKRIDEINSELALYNITSKEDKI